VKVTALAAHTPEAVRAALVARGWDAQPAWFAATGVQPLVVLLEDITEAEREALVHWGAKAGADVLTGDGWALVGAAASRLAPLARPDRVPAGLARLGPDLGHGLLDGRQRGGRLGRVGVDHVRPVVDGAGDVLYALADPRIGLEVDGLAANLGAQGRQVRLQVLLGQRRRRALQRLLGVLVEITDRLREEARCATGGCLLALLHVLLPLQLRIRQGIASPGLGVLLALLAQQLRPNRFLVSQALPYLLQALRDVGQTLTYGRRYRHRFRARQRCTAADVRLLLIERDLHGRYFPALAIIACCVV